MSIKSLPGEYFVQTYSYFKYFVSTQPYNGGSVCTIPSKWWRDFFYTIFGGTEFKETIKVAIGTIVSTLEARDGFTVPTGNQQPRTLDHVLLNIVF